MGELRVLRTPAARVGLAASTLEKFRQRGEGPRFIRLGGRAVGYDPCDLDAWLEARKAESACQAAGDGAA